VKISTFDVAISIRRTDLECPSSLLTARGEI